ncbi:branched-chain amino acid aminotransferase group I [Lewinella marina]|uniref:branched-chain-amino-acid transaminase n=1 Tax=Neolewinella marina TaxID=438751 RepID=A0A2G0CGQ7_9BACT|nr:aminotransferase class IV [Neolewinella marina]NJB86427.1 branched-chain amino acid aminotransferase group I [Neolewinella marina]PHK99110.1 aminotransferase IV [Neolewinella marina]
MLQGFNPANENIQVYIDGRLLPRSEARVSVFDSSVQGGDAVWEGLRVYDGRVFSLDAHLDRLFDSAHALWFQNVPSRETVVDAIRQTLEANNMHNDVHIRLTLTRGEKITSGMDPRLNQRGCTLIVLAEHKPPVYPASITLSTSSVRRNSAMSIDSKVHHNNLINNILAKIEANHAGADAGLMLDKDGFVAEANGVNVFLIRRGKVRTPWADYCLPGITRATVLQLCHDHGIPCEEARLSTTEFYVADEVFTTGTMGELTRVSAIDGREIVNKHGESVLERIQSLFRKLTATGGTRLV